VKDNKNIIISKMNPNGLNSLDTIRDANNSYERT